MAFTKTAGVEYGTPEVVLSTTAASGSNQTAIRTDGQLIAFDGVVVTDITSSGVAATGSQAVASRRDHTHGAPALASAATKTELEDGAITTAYTSPGNQQAHDSAAKAWAVVLGDGTLQSPSYNTNSIVKVSTGRYEHVFEVDFADVDYAYACTSKGENGAVICDLSNVAYQDVRIQSSSHVYSNSAWSGVGFGQQATT